jgi:hypothetical protein
MHDDRKTLEDLNVKIGEMEDQGDRDAWYWLDGILAPQLAFRRANGSFDNRCEFLKKVKPREPHEPKRVTEIVSIDLHGNRAIVTCIVTMGDKRYHNLRLFVRDEEHEEQWKLLGWANEQI